MPTKKTVPPPSEETTPYRELRQQLEALMERMDDPDLDIEAAAAAYEQGLALVRQLEGRLQTLENRIRQVTADLPDDE